MAVLRAIFVALSILVCAVIYSDIVYNEELYSQTNDSESSGNVANAEITEEAAFHHVSVHDRLLTGESGSFHSPHYPRAERRLDCIWLIRVTPPNRVRLVWVDWETEVDRDYVFIHDGDTTEHPLLLVKSGPSKPGTVQSTGHQLLVRFVTDSKGVSRGFQANYYSIPPCFATISSSSGTIVSPNYPMTYDLNTHCEWLISVGASELILLEFLDVNTEEDHDVIQVYDGTSDRSPFLRRLSGDRRNSVILSSTTSNAAFIRFTSDNSVAGSGFVIKFRAGSNADLVQYLIAEYPDVMMQAEKDIDALISANAPHLFDDISDVETVADVSLYPGYVGNATG